MMDNIRSGNLSVAKMKKEIEESLAILELGYLHKRAQRQLVDGAKFLEMLQEPIYKNCLTVSRLKKKISEERNKVKERLITIDRYMPGHQFTFFETIGQVTKEQEEKLAQEKEKLLNEIRWLHKCLGMCSNRNYFK